MSPNASIRNEYSKYLYVSLLVALLLHATAFAFWPEYVPSVYKLPVKIPNPFEVVPDYDVPPKPKDIEPPVDLADVIESEDADPEATIEPNFLSLRDLPKVIPPPLKEPSGYFGWDKEPELLRRAVPGYPDIARKAEIEGTVMVLVTIDESGRVYRAEILKSDAAVFDEAAIQAAYGHVFIPAEQNGIPVKATISLTFRFVLRD